MEERERRTGRVETCCGADELWDGREPPCRSPQADPDHSDLRYRTVLCVVFFNGPAIAPVPVQFRFDNLGMFGPS